MGGGDFPIFIFLNFFLDVAFFYFPTYIYNNTNYNFIDIWTALHFTIKTKASNTNEYWHFFLHKMFSCPSSRFYTKSIILSCQGTFPAGKLHQCLMRFHCILPSLDALLGACTCTVSSRFSPLLHSPGSICPFCTCMSKSLFCRAGYRLRIRLWSRIQALTISLTVSAWCCIVVNNIWNLFTIIPKAFSTTLLALDNL